MSCILVRAIPVTRLSLLFPSLVSLSSHFKHPNSHCNTKSLFLFISRAITHVDFMHQSFLSHMLEIVHFLDHHCIQKPCLYVPLRVCYRVLQVMVIFKQSMQQLSQHNMIFTFAAFSLSSDVYGSACSPSPTCGAETRSLCSLR